jgi:glutamate-ammonia-ligase adenylyltransferase
MTSLAKQLQTYGSTHEDGKAIDEFLEFETLTTNIQLAEQGLSHIFAAAPYLKDCAHKNLEWLEDALALDAADCVKVILMATDECAASCNDEAEIRQFLRQQKLRLALISALAEISGATGPEHTTEWLALLADKCLDAALDHLVAAKFLDLGVALTEDLRPSRQSGLMVLALGKHGGLELNYSSDIDIVTFYDLARSPIADNPRVGRIYEKMVRDLASIMQDRDENGYVFRTDLRLRPDPGSTPVAISVDAAMGYYESRGQNWERAAWIKARPCAGDVEAGELFIKELSPFIWRKHLDYATIGDIKTIKRQINTAKNVAGRVVLGHNVKLGSGGIREIEFFAQVQQLIAGGREPQLRTRPTCVTLKELAAAGWIDGDVCVDLTQKYWFLRAVENRLQMLRDEQTHSLPATDEQLEPVVALLPFEDVETFKVAYREHLDAVVSHYGELFSDDEENGDLDNLVFTGSDEDPATWATLSEIGFQDPSTVIETVKRWHYGGYAATRADKARQTLTELIPGLLRTMSNARNADEALRHFDFFLSKLPAGVQLFALLQNNARLRTVMIDFMAAAPRMTDAILQRVHIVDGLIDPAFYDEVPDAETLKAKASEFLGEARSYEDLIDRARIFGQEQIFLISAGLVAGTIGPAKAASQFSALAELQLNWVFDAVRKEFEVKHGTVEGARVSLLAFGKLASREMNAQSDLDFILLYDAPEGSENSNGTKQLATSHYFIRLTQRLIAAISAPTAEGVLYETDMRLRPSGNAGPLATSLRGFERYQREDAWTWEHMALSRARVVYADADLGTDIDAVISDILSEPRDLEKVTHDVLDMRARLLKERGPKSTWDIKLASGGLIDLEFIGQYAQLVYGAELGVPQAPPKEIFQAMERAGVLNKSELLNEVHDRYNVVIQLTSACLSSPLEVDKWSDGFTELLTRSSNFPTIQLLEEDLKQRQEEIAAVFSGFVNHKKG